MITPSFSLTATERVLPKLALDFTTASLDSRITFTRTTGASNPATYVNSSGVVTAAINDQPRFDYDPVTLACKGLLIEESRQNILPYSEQVDNVTWGKGAISVSANVAVSPSGLTDADKIVEDSATSTHLVNQSITTTAVAWTWSCFAKAAGRDWIYLQISDSGNNIRRAWFNLATGVKGTVNAAFTSATIDSIGNGWYRCTATIGVARAGNSLPTIGLASGDNNTSYAGDGTSGVYVWGAQLELGAFATSYIPTTTTALTRNADVATMTGTNFSSWFNASEGSFMVRGFANSGSGRRYIQLDNAGNTDRMLLQTGTAAQFESRTSGVTDVAIDAGAASAGVFNNMCFAYKLNNFGLAINGGATVTDTSGAIPGVNRLQLGFGGELNGYLSRVFYYPQRLTNSEIQAFSK